MAARGNIQRFLQMLANSLNSELASSAAKLTSIEIIS
jgi:hypothetical protein